VQRVIGLDDVAQHAIQPKAHYRLTLVRLDVDVRDIFTRRLRQQGIDHADDRRVMLAVEQVFNRWQGIDQAGNVQILADVIGHLGSRLVALGVGFGQKTIKLVAAQRLGAQLDAMNPTDFRQRSKRQADGG
jgi:hypothetical protein